MPPRKDPKPLQKQKNKISHNRNWLWGHHAVQETIQANRWPILDLYSTPDKSSYFQQLLEQHASEKRPSNLTIETVSADRLTQLCRASDHQGIVARMSSFPYHDPTWLDQSIENWLEPSTPLPSSKPLKPLLVICDRIQDAHNFGAILRCCDGVAANCVIVSDRDQCPVTPHVARSSSGAVNHLPIVQVPSLTQTVEKLRKRGFRILSADANTRSSLYEAQLDTPSVVIIGSEAHGVAPQLSEQCDQQLFIPMLGHVTSLNAAVAAGILLYEIRRQQQSSPLMQP